MVVERYARERAWSPRITPCPAPRPPHQHEAANEHDQHREQDHQQQEGDRGRSGGVRGRHANQAPGVDYVNYARQYPALLLDV